MALSRASGEALATGLRIIIAAVGVVLTKYKIVDESQVGTALVLVQDITTMLMIVIPAVWELWARFKSELETRAREAVALNVGIKIADATAGPTPLVPPENAQTVIAAVTSTPPQAVPQVDDSVKPAPDPVAAQDGKPNPTTTKEPL